MGMMGVGLFRYRGDGGGLSCGGKARPLPPGCPHPNPLPPSGRGDACWWERVYCCDEEHRVLGDGPLVPPLPSSIEGEGICRPSAPGTPCVRFAPRPPRCAKGTFSLLVRRWCWTRFGVLRLLGRCGLVGGCLVGV